MGFADYSNCDAVIYSCDYKSFDFHTQTDIIRQRPLEGNNIDEICLRYPALLTRSYIFISFNMLNCFKSIFMSETYEYKAVFQLSEILI